MSGATTNSSSRPPAANDRRFAPMLGPLLGLKLIFALACLFVILRLDLPQFQGKAMGERMIAYPLLVAAIPAIWWWRKRTGRSAGGYPYAADFLLTLGIVLDVGGNIFDFYDSLPWYDDLMHLLNWGFYAGAFGSLLLRTKLGPWPIFGLSLGFGAITAILWEGMEWLGFIRFGMELETAYFDTLLDEHLALVGATVAAWIVARVAARRSANGAITT
jgi:hypothetical protein